MQNNHLEAIRRLQQKAEEVSRLQKEASERMDQSSHHSLASMESEEDDTLSAGGSIPFSDSDYHQKSSQPLHQTRAPSDLVRKETRYVGILRILILIQLIVMGILLSIGTFRVVKKAQRYDIITEASLDLDNALILVEACDGNHSSTNDETTMVFDMSSSSSSLSNPAEPEWKEIPQDVKDQAKLFILPSNDNIFESDSCQYRLWVTHSQLLDDPNYLDDFAEKQEECHQNVIMTVIVCLCFAMIGATFLVFNWLEEKRQARVIDIATKSSAIVESLFPAQVRERMLNKQNLEDSIIKTSGHGGGETIKTGPPSIGPTMMRKHGMGRNVVMPKTMSVKQYLSRNSRDDISVSQPIADLFQNTTVIFADIAGFTAWSSQREPSQVFMLLESLYGSFDEIAKTLRVFKVETIGDSYMAVTGLPIPDKAHAVNMSRFAYHCLRRMKDLTEDLEATLGPGTTDLNLRIGIHSGAVTAGVLRGEKSRFQLFGDTVNTASRMESMGCIGKIQVSQETADLLKAAGKEHWLKPRDEVVFAKGKGELKTYWLDPTRKKQLGRKNPRLSVGKPPASPKLLNNSFSKLKMGKLSLPLDHTTFDEKYTRLIDWNVDVLLHHLARVISSRSRSAVKGAKVNHSSEVSLLPSAIDDVAEIIVLPPFDLEVSASRRIRPDVSTLQQTRADLHEYVSRIASMYNDVPFHNFEHASHVTLCANKLLNRLINSDEYETEEELHDATFGISSDPLTHFAIVFAALIHDAGHIGLPNAQLVKDKTELAVKFDNKSVAEQNSTHLGWQLLMDPRFERLRRCIYQTNVERKRFRQVIINSIMATDIADRKMNEGRQQKWDRAFGRKITEDSVPSQIQDAMNHKATVVIEHIIQVSDVAHTMQHWHIYRRWNERLFYEMHEAYRTDRVDVDPSLNWYLGEIGFFDYYLIPLAMKIKECGVFGASGYEYVSYVLKNKKEWEQKGQQVVQEMVMLKEDMDESGNYSDDSSDTKGSDFDTPAYLTSDDESITEASILEFAMFDENR